MPKYLLTALFLIAPLTVAQTTKPAAAPAAPTVANPTVIVHTSQGDITLELYADKSPKSVANFLQIGRAHV